MRNPRSPFVYVLSSKAIVLSRLTLGHCSLQLVNIGLFGGKRLEFISQFETLDLECIQYSLFRRCENMAVILNRHRGARNAAIGLSVVAMLACVSARKTGSGSTSGGEPVDEESKFQGTVELKLKPNQTNVEKINYTHRSRSTSFEDIEVRHQKEEALEFISSTSVAKVDGDRFTQLISIDKKTGTGNLHDFAMPEVGERLELTSDSRGRILRAGDYPANSIFFVPPISLPDGAVAVGDTWALTAQWLSLEEMVPYQLEMASILKNVKPCGTHKCAEIEISGEVTLQGPLVQMMSFKSLWKGFLSFDVDSGTVLWSRVDSEEQFMSGNVRRSVNSCLEAALIEPAVLKPQTRTTKPCETLSNPGDIAPRPGSMK
jgi:hypothetical protein